MRTVLKLALLLLGAAVAGSLSAVPVQAAAPPSPYTLKLLVAPKSDQPSNLVLRAYLAGSPPPAGASMAFFVVTREFGHDMEVPIGTADMAGNSSVSIEYAPTWAGSQKFVARLSGTSLADPPTATTTYSVTTSAPGPLYGGANPDPPFTPVGRVFLTALLTLVAGVWLTLIVIVVEAVYRLPRLASEPGTET